ncbi:MAG TPA: hypothetical protein VHF89_12900 [Solirubrobacteraceae bacterium]|nr:hypothetical protein [Solirubrobacteraceae bacterium]
MRASEPAMARPSALASALTAALAAPAAAAAQSAVIPMTETAGSPPRLSAPWVVWAEAKPDLTVKLLVSDLSTPRPIVLGGAEPPPGWPPDTVVLSADGNPWRLVLHARWERCDQCKGVPDVLGAAALGGAADSLRPLGDEADGPYVTPEVVGDHIAYRLYRLPGPDTIRLVDPAGRERIDVATEHGTSHVLAGHLLAHRRPDGDLVVEEWRSRRVVYRPELPAGWAPEGLRALDAGGNAVWSAGPGRHGVTTPAAPALRELPIASELPPRVAGGRLLHQAGDGLAISDLDGRLLHALPGVRSAADFDGRRVAWLETPCAIPLIVVWDTDGARPAVPAPLCPGVRVVRRPRVVSGRLAVRVRCAGTPLTGCAATVSAVADGRPLVPAQLRLRPRERRTVLLAPAFRGAPLPRAEPLRVAITTAPTARPEPGERRVRRFGLRGRRR